MDRPDTHLYIIDTKNSNEKMTNSDFLENIAPNQISLLFEELPDIYFFAKDLQGCFTMANKTTVKAFGFKTEKDMLGKTDFDIASVEIASKYKEADQLVISHGKPVRNIIEPVPDPAGILRWYSTSKVPIFNKSGSVIGVAVIMKDISSAGSKLGPFQDMAEVIDYIFKNYQAQITIDELAEIAKLSVRQLERRFRKLFGLTPIRYINEHRIRMACINLRESNKNIADIAGQCGFYDHAHFVHKFRASMKIAPSEYRVRYQNL